VRLPSNVFGALFEEEVAAGQLWELDAWWARVVGFPTHDQYHVYLLLEPTDHDVWRALRIGTGEVVEIQVSSLMYDRVA
jgi:hypothetical protein